MSQWHTRSFQRYKKLHKLIEVDSSIKGAAYTTERKHSECNVCKLYRGYFRQFKSEEINFLPQQISTGKVFSATWESIIGRSSPH